MQKFCCDNEINQDLIRDVIVISHTGKNKSLLCLALFVGVFANADFFVFQDSIFRRKEEPSEDETTAGRPWLGIWSFQI